MAKCTKPDCKSTSFKMEIVEIRDSQTKMRAISCNLCDTIISILDFANSTIEYDKINEKLGIDL